MDQMEVQFSRRFLAAYALLLTIGAAVYLGCVTFLNVPKENVRYVDTIVGFIIGTVMSVPIGFYFGSSKSSQQKDTNAADLNTQLAAAVASSAPGVVEKEPPTALAKPEAPL